MQEMKYAQTHWENDTVTDLLTNFIFFFAGLSWLNSLDLSKCIVLESMMLYLLGKGQCFKPSLSLIEMKKIRNH